MKNKLQKLAVIAIVFCFNSAFSKTTSYNGTTWSSGVPSGTSDIVTITGGSYSLPANITYASLTLNGGSFNTNSKTFAVTDVTLTSGTFTTAASFSISGTLTISSGAYTLGSSSRTFTAGNVIISSGTLSLPSNLTVTNTLTLNGGSLDKNGRTLTVENMTLTSGTFTSNAAQTIGANLIMNGGAYTLGTASRTLTVDNITISTGTLSLPNNLTVTGILTLNGGNLNKNTRTLTVANMTLASGTFTSDAAQAISGTLIMNGGTFTLTTASNTLTVANATINSGTLSLPNNLTVTGTLTLNGGSLNKNSKTLTVENMTLISGTFTSNAAQTVGGTLTMNGGSYTLGTASRILTTDNTIITSGTWSLPNNLTVSGTLTLNGGSLATNGNTLNVENIILTSGTLDLGGNNLSIAGNMTLNGGTFDMDGATATLSGNITVTTATSTIKSTGISRLNASSNTLTINGASLIIDNAEVVIDNLTFSSNHDINTSNGGFLSFDNSSMHTLTSVDNGSHVIGKVRLYTDNNNNNTFLFPIGDGAVYAPFIITPTSVPNGGTDFTYYFEASYVGSLSPNPYKDITTLNSVSGYEYWVASASSSSVIGTVALRYDNNAVKTGKTNVNSITNINTDLIVAQLLTSNSKWTGIASSKNTGSNITTATTTTGISPNTSYTLASNNGRTTFMIPLPVTMVSFDAIANNADKSVKLKWVTSSEKNSKYFEVLYSTDMVNWTVIGTVKSKGNGDEFTTYVFNHIQPTTINHYKLREVAENGNFAYSDIKLVRFTESTNAKVALFPNPANAICNIQLDNIELNNPIEIKIIDQSGKIVFTKSVNETNVTSLTESIDVSSFETGIYSISISGANALINQKLIINR